MAFSLRPSLQIVGKNGVGVTKLRDDLGVRIDFSDGVADGTASGSKKKAKTSVKIKGRKENAEEAQKRILAQSERFVSRDVRDAAARG